jgi:hypothetical protein
MTSRRIQLTRFPQKCIAVGKQFFWEAVDLGGDLRVLDLTLSVTALSGQTPTVTIAVLTSVQDDVEEGWATLETFDQVDGQAGADQTKRKVMVGALRYVRFHVTQLGTGASCYFSIEGEARTVE